MGFRVSNLGFRVSNLGFRVSNLGFRALGFRSWGFLVVNLSVVVVLVCPFCIGALSPGLRLFTGSGPEKFFLGGRRSFRAQGLEVRVWRWLV